MRLILLLPLLFWRAFVLVHLWGWFIVQMDLPPLTFLHAAGVLTVINLLFPRAHTDSLVDPRLSIAANKVVDLVAYFLAPALTFGLGWAFHAFM